MFLIISFLTAEGFFTGVAFLIGALVSMISGTVGMVIATQANFRTTYCAKQSLASAFRVAYRAGVAMGFALVSLGLLGMWYLIKCYCSLSSFTRLLKDSMTEAQNLNILVHCLKLLLDMVSEDHLLLSLEELEEVSIQRLLMLVLTWLERLNPAFLKTLLKTQQQLLTMLETMLVMSQV